MAHLRNELIAKVSSYCLTYFPKIGESTSKTNSNIPNIIPICVSVMPFFKASAGKKGASKE